MSRDYGPWLDEFRDVLMSGQRALDIGCGKGYDTRLLLDAGVSVVSLDRNLDNLRHAAGHASDACFICTDLRNGLPLRDSTFDLAVASLSLHYFDRVTTDRILRDIHRVTTPGATLLARVNAVGDVASSWGTGIEHEPDYFEVEPGLFKRFFTDATLRDALEPYFDIATIVAQETLAGGRSPKQTLVVRAIRRDG